MTYEEYQTYMAGFGFISCPLSAEEFKEASATLHPDDLFGLGCDVNAGVSFEVAMLVNDRNKQPINN